MIPSNIFSGSLGTSHGHDAQDRSLAGRVHHAAAYLWIYGGEGVISAVAWIVAFSSSCPSPGYVVLMGLCEFALLIEAVIRIISLNLKMLKSPDELIDLGVITFSLISFPISISGDCSSTKNWLATFVALAVMGRSVVQLIKLLLDVRKNRRYEMTQDATLDFADVRQSMDSDRDEDDLGGGYGRGDFVLGETDDEDDLAAPIHTPNRTPSPEKAAPREEGISSLSPPPSKSNGGSGGSEEEHGQDIQTRASPALSGDTASRMV